MDVIFFIYTILLFLLYACAISGSFYAWMNTKDKVHLAFIAFFVFFLIDLSIISIIEFVYQIPINFTTSPVYTFAGVRSLSFLIGMFIYSYLFLILFKTPFKKQYCIPPVLFVCITVFPPYFTTGILADWFHSAGRYLSIISLLFIFLRKLYQSKNTMESKQWYTAWKLTLTILGFMVAAFIEITITIINWQAYSQWIVSFSPRLSERVFTEDIYSVVISIWYIIQCHHVVADNINSSILSGNMVTKIPSSQFDLAKENFSIHLGLTKRESEILELILKDMTNQEITEKLFISLGTAKTHVHNILQKANVSKRAELIEAFKNFMLDKNVGYHSYL